MSYERAHREFQKYFKLKLKMANEKFTQKIKTNQHFFGYFWATKALHSISIVKMRLLA